MIFKQEAQPNIEDLKIKMSSNPIFISPTHDDICIISSSFMNDTHLTILQSHIYPIFFYWELQLIDTFDKSKNGVCKLKDTDYNKYGSVNDVNLVKGTRM